MLVVLVYNVFTNVQYPLSEMNGSIIVKYDCLNLIALESINSIVRIMTAVTETDGFLVTKVISTQDNALKGV